MDDYEAMKLFCDRFGIDRHSAMAENALCMIREEASFEQERLKRDGYRKRDRFSLSCEAALDRLSEWFKRPEGWHIEDLPGFIASHRRTASWAILAGEQHRKENPNMER